jgi:hypothetical protein
MDFSLKFPVKQKNCRRADVPPAVSMAADGFVWHLMYSKPAIVKPVGLSLYHPVL